MDPPTWRSLPQRRQRSSQTTTPRGGSRKTAAAQVVPRREFRRPSVRKSKPALGDGFGRATERRPQPLGPRRDLFGRRRGATGGASGCACFSATHRLPIGHTPQVVSKHKRRSSAAVECPFCGQTDELAIDLGGGERQTYTEDCAVCCRPRIVHVEPGEEPGELNVWIEREE